MLVEIKNTKRRNYLDKYRADWDIGKEIKWGIFGTKLFEEVNPFKSGEIARRLAENIKGDEFPEGMSNIVLISLTSNAMQAPSASDFIRLLKTAQNLTQ